MSLGLTEILVIAAVILLLFGAKKIPELARSLGKAKGEFKKGLAEGEKLEEEAEKIEETFRLEAPIALRIPISLVRSRTEIRVMTAIMIEETTKEIETKAIST